VSSSSSSSSSLPSLLKNGGARCSGHNGISVSVLRTWEFSRRTGTNSWGRGREFIVAARRASCDRWNGKAQLYDVRFVRVQMLGPSSLWYSIIVTAVDFFRRHPSK
jgi:hypothetical protein